jgi:hypothetical protein
MALANPLLKIMETNEWLGILLEIIFFAFAFCVKLYIIHVLKVKSILQFKYSN